MRNIILSIIAVHMNSWHFPQIRYKIVLKYVFFFFSFSTNGQGKEIILKMKCLTSWQIVVYKTRGLLNTKISFI